MTEFLILVIFVAIIVNFFKFLKKIASSKSTSKPAKDKTEVWVESELEKHLLKKGYVIFGDLIIPSVSKSIPSTQIDHVIVSRYGIFCLETKSHQGYIYGNEKSEKWKQYLGNKNYSFYSPIRQNKHHVMSLEYLLRSRLKSPIHSYIVFPSARKVRINGEDIDLTLRNTIRQIENHMRPVYTVEDVEAIAKGLAYVSTRSFEFRDNHIESVKKYIATKDSRELVYSSKHTP